MRGSCMTRPASLDKSDNPFTKIKRIGFRHRESPPNGSESKALPQRNPLRVNLRTRPPRRPFLRRSSALIWLAAQTAGPRHTIDAVIALGLLRYQRQAELL